MLPRIPRFLVIALLFVTGPLLGQENEDWRLFTAPRISDVAASRDGSRIVAVERQGPRHRLLARERGADGLWSESEAVGAWYGNPGEGVRLLGLDERNRAHALIGIGGRFAIWSEGVETPRYGVTPETVAFSPTHIVAQQGGLLRVFSTEGLELASYDRRAEGRVGVCAIHPRGRMIAWIEHRESEGEVYSHVYLAPTKKTGRRGRGPAKARRINTGDAEARSLAWSPDGKRLALVRRRALSAPEDPLLPAKYFGDGWEIELVDIASEEVTRPLWSRERGPFVEAQVAWNTNEELIVRRARGGHHRVDRFELGERDYFPVSPRDRDVTPFSIDPNSGHLQFAIETPETGLVPVALPTGEPLPRIPDGTSGTEVAFERLITPKETWLVAATADTPPRLLTTTKGKETVLFGATEPLYFRAPAPRTWTFEAEHEKDLERRVWEFPPARLETDPPAPTLVYLHGGPARRVRGAFHELAVYDAAFVTCRLLAASGYRVIALNYLGGSGRGRDFREPSRAGAEGAIEIGDLGDLAKVLRAREDIADDAVFGAWGPSYGGYLATMAATRMRKTYRAAVSLAGVSDWRLWRDRFDPERRWICRGLELEVQSSPHFYLQRQGSPLLLIHGEGDEVVPVSHSLRLARAARVAGIPVTTQLIDRPEHDLLAVNGWVLLPEIRGFFDRWLRARTPHTRIPEGSSRFVAELKGTPVEVFAYKPKSYRGERMIFVHHGTLRNADDYRDHARAMAERFGALVIAPRFDRERFPNRDYHYGGIQHRDGQARAPEEWTYTAIPRLAELVRAIENKPELPFWLIGHSAGGQFVGRLSAFQKTGAVRHVAANPGSQLVPTRDLPFGYGFGDLPEELADDERLRFYLSQPLTIYLGTLDNKPDAYFATNPTAMKQGGGRLQRGRYCFEQAKKLAENKGWPFNWRIVEAEGVGHDHQKMFDHPACEDALFGK